MRLVFLGGFFCALMLNGQQVPSELEGVRAQVNAGVLPRKALDEAERSAQRLRDEAVLKDTLYRSVRLEDLNESQATEMLAAARRLLAQTEQDWQNANRLVVEGVSPRSALQRYEEELDHRRETLRLAELRAALFRELVESVRAEESFHASQANAPDTPTSVAEAYAGNGAFRPSQLDAIRLSFESEFQRPLPVSARGETALHRSLGFDHRGRVDVALHPDGPEGRWLRRRLEELRIPYFAFRADVRAKSTGAHIHIGPQSVRFQRAD